MMRINLGLLFVVQFVLLTAACNQSSTPYIVVQVSGISDGIEQLDVIPNLQNMLPPQKLSFDLRVTPRAQADRFSFVIEPGLPSDWPQVDLRLQVSVAGFDHASCLLGTGDNIVRLSADSANLPLTVSLRPYDAPDCTGTRQLVLHKMSASEILPCPILYDETLSKGRIDGWGFEPDSVLQWNGFTLVQQGFCSPTGFVLSDLPKELRMNGLLRITNRDGSTAELMGAFQ